MALLGENMQQKQQQENKIIAITRPENVAHVFGGGLKRAGFSVFYEPLLTIEPVKLGKNAPDISACHAVIFTSAQAVSAFLGIYLAQDLSHLCAYCVGAATAQALQDAGFIDVRSADGDVHALYALIKGEKRPPGARMIYFCAQKVAQPLDSWLRADGCEVESCVLYDARPVSMLSDAFLELVKAKKLAAITFFSARTANAFAALWKKEKSAISLENVKILCISERTAKCVQADISTGTYIAQHPDANHMHQLVCQQCGECAEI